jgi:WD40 repeat protein
MRAFSPDGKALLAANADGSVGRWDLENPKASFVEWPRQKGGVWSAAYSPDGRWLATGSKLDDTFAVWDLTWADAEPVLESDPEPAAAGSGPPVAQPGGVPVAFSPDGRTLATDGLKGTIWLWHPGDLARPFASLRGHRGGLLALDFYDHGKHLASSGEDGTIRLWSLDEPSAAPVVLQNGSASANSLDVGSDDRTLVAASSRGIMLWKLGAPEAPPVVIPAGHLYKVVLSPDGKRLASGGTGSARLRLWDLGSTGRPLVLKGPASFMALAFSPDRALLAAGGLT